MTDLHTRLRSAIEERLALAQAAAGYGWPSITGVFVEGDPPLVAPDQITEHIAANSPDRVIRACRADLARLHEHAPTRTAMEKWAPELDGLLVDYLCAGHGPFPLLHRVPWPCPEVRSMAEVYGVEL